MGPYSEIPSHTARRRSGYTKDEYLKTLIYSFLSELQPSSPLDSTQYSFTFLTVLVKKFYTRSCGSKISCIILFGRTFQYVAEASFLCHASACM